MKQIHYISYITLITCFFQVGLFAQQDLQFSQFKQHSLIHNPAAAGLNQGINLHALARFQWVGLNGAPMSQAISADIPVPYLNSGWGVTVVNSIEGALRTTNAHFVYSYHQKLNPEFYISYGLGLGILQQGVSSNKLITPEGSYNGETINHNDDLLSENNFSAIAPSVNAGVLIRYKNLFAGISLDGGIFANSSFRDLNTNITSPVKLALITNYTFELSDFWHIIPSFHYKFSNAYNQLEIGAAAEWDNFIEFGINWRGYNNKNFDALIGIVAVKLNNNLKFTYSYDYTLSEFNNISKGSHEIGIQYAIKALTNKPTKTKKIYNTRYL